MAENELKVAPRTVLGKNVAKLRLNALFAKPQR